jgi:hypothetical protein
MSSTWSRAAEDTDIDYLTFLKATLDEAGKQADLPQPIMQGWTGDRLLFSWAALVNETTIVELWVALAGATKSHAVLESGTRCWVTADRGRHWDGRGPELHVRVTQVEDQQLSASLGVPEIPDAYHTQNRPSSFRPLPLEPGPGGNLNPDLPEGLRQVWEIALSQGHKLSSAPAPDTHDPVRALRIRLGSAREI